jgi:negative regulator of replication initiation
MKKTKLDRYEAQTSLEPSPEQIQQAKEWAVNRMMEVVDKLPANPAPVVESFQELARQAKFGVPRESTLIISGDEKKPIQVPKSNTLHNSGDSEKKSSENVTCFDSGELELLRKIENGE